MAVVDLTGKVANSIEANLNKSLLARRMLLVGTLENEITSKNNERHMLEQFRKRAWEGLEHLAPQTPAEWKKIVSYLDVVFWPSSELPGRRIDPCGVVVPRSSSCITMRLDFKKSDELPPPLQNLFDRYFAALDEHNAFRDAAVATLRALLASCKTLNNAVKKYPDLTLHTPQQYIDRMAVVIVKGKKIVRELAPEEALDFSKLTASAVLRDMAPKQE